MRFLSICVLGLGLCVPAHAYVDRETAVVRIMNKAAGKVQTIALPVGRPAVYEKLTMRVRACKHTDPYHPEDDYMLVEIRKAGDGLIFSNWMDRNEPGDAPLQDADYDVWLVKCE